ncbi:GyrI-like domain-containing protein [Streptomyces katsurahamanus]|uniref:GyrI-like domain-containing protein n=1 Tax=Streptomyces katsurahamanus TaxID=2577098 RepID=A0ABW9NYG8_9ACTN|nr:GyrI-like domain-containing protein [Streptomyces katsurahamanus]MQS38348.1 GyrI-like domain-containing protein [Streptomyces katsurahamanus]
MTDGESGEFGEPGESGVEPVIVERGEQLYAFVHGSVRMDAFGVLADRLGELISWLTAHGVALAGAPFFRFNTVDLAGESDVEAGIPVVSRPEPKGDIRIGALPSGRYATVVFTGHPDRLSGVAAALREWAAGEGLEWDMTETGGVERWGCRLESYRTDPRVEPDPGKWEIELAFRLAD